MITLNKTQQQIVVARAYEYVIEGRFRLIQQAEGDPDFRARIAIALILAVASILMSNMRAGEELNPDGFAFLQMLAESPPPIFTRSDISQSMTVLAEHSLAAFHRYEEARKEILDVWATMSDAERSAFPAPQDFVKTRTGTQSVSFSWLR